MGEVYRAAISRLSRIVAIKVLPDHLSSSTEAKQRFEREARAISALNHPNICTLYDVGHQNGIDYLVMEFLEGRRSPIGCAEENCQWSRHYATRLKSPMHWRPATGVESFTGI